MAIVSVEGEVTRTFYGGLGAAVVEKFTKRDGSEGKDYFTAFFNEPHGLSEGDTGTFRGTFSAKIREYDKDGETRQAVDKTLNSTKFTRKDSAPPSDTPW